jgi:hypothetical protein
VRVLGVEKLEVLAIRMWVQGWFKVKMEVKGLISIVTCAWHCGGGGMANTGDLFLLPLSQ